MSSGATSAIVVECERSSRAVKLCRICRWSASEQRQSETMSVRWPVSASTWPDYQPYAVYMPCVWRVS